MTAWTPPADPDPSEILTSAEDDTRSGQDARALAKFLWFHHNALRYCESLYGVRLSLALASWQELARVYPPAQDAFVRTRDEAEAAFAANPTSFRLFKDVAALNQRLGDGQRTADAFGRAAAADPAAARRLYHLAEPDLIAAGLYAACGPFLDPPRQLASAAASYHNLNEWEESQPKVKDGVEVPKLARRFYTHEVATLVGLLVLNRWPDEAIRARDQALTVLDDPDFRTMLDAALTGHLPPSLFGAGS